MTSKWWDLLERVGWTFVQALAATIYAAGSASSFQTIDWQAALTGAVLAALLAVLKVAGVNASTAAALAHTPDPDPTPPTAEAERAAASRSRHERWIP